MRKQNHRQALWMGKVVEAEVVEIIDNQRVMLRMEDSSIIAESLPDLEIGDRILARVTQLKPKVVFHLISRKNPGSEGIEVRV